MKRIVLSLLLVGSFYLGARAQVQPGQVPAKEEPKVVVKDSVSVAAKGNGQPKLSLQECINTAVNNNLTVKRAFFNVETNRVNLLQAYGAFLPSVSVSGNYNLNFGRSVNPVTYAYVNGVVKSFNPVGVAQLTIFNGYRIRYNYQSNKKYLVAADLDLEKSKNDVILNVANYYVNVILNRELYENAKVQLESSQQQLGRIKLQVEAGALPKSNELNQEAIVATNETTMINQENTLNISLLNLKQAMQVPASTPLDVIIPEISVEDMVIDQTPEEIYAISSQTLPQVKSALLKVEAADLAFKSAWGAYLPRLTVAGSVNSNFSSASETQYNQPVYVLTQIGQVGTSATPPANQLVYGYVPQTPTVSNEKYKPLDQLHNNIYKTVGVTLSIPILNGFNTRGNVENALITKELAKVTVQDNENILRQAIETAYNNAVAAAKTYVASLKQVSYSEEAYRMTKIRFDNGAANFVEYQISANDLFSAKSSLSRAKYSFLLTKKIIDFYMGKSIEY
jgi:outer membrane protein